MFKKVQSLFQRQNTLETPLPNATTPYPSLPSVQISTAAITINGPITVADGQPVSEDHCYIVAEVANVVAGTPFSSSTSITIPIATASFTFGSNLSITPAPIPITVYDFSDTCIHSGETLVSPTAYYIFSAYSSTFVKYIGEGIYSTSSGTGVLFGPLAIAIPSTDQSRFAFTAENALVDYFGTPSCSVEVTEVFVTQVVVTASEPPGTPSTTSKPSSSELGLLSTFPLAPPARNTVAASTASPSNAGTTTSLPTATRSSPVITEPSSITTSLPATPSLKTSAKIGVGVGVSLGVIVVFISIFGIWHRRRSKMTFISGKRRKRRSGWRAYFQNKGELDAENQRRHEVENTDQRRELDAEVRHELEVIETRQELLGAECAQELEP